MLSLSDRLLRLPDLTSRSDVGLIDRVPSSEPSRKSAFGECLLISEALCLELRKKKYIYSQIFTRFKYYNTRTVDSV